FLGAGSVIHGCGGEQDMRKMGGLHQYMPWTRRTMQVACLAIAGLPVFAGFYSKDEILSGAFAFHPSVWFVGAFGAGLTAFYMFRLYYMTFAGEYRGAKDQGDAHSDQAHGHHAEAHTPHESPPVMTGVLVILALLSLIGGWIGWPAALGGPFPTPF